MNETKLRFSEPLLREAVRVFVFRAITRILGWRFFLACALVAASMASLLAQGDRSWVVGVLAAVLLFAAVFIIVIYRAHLHHTVGRFREMRRPEATLSYTEEQIKFTSELGSSTLPWSSIWRFAAIPVFGSSSSRLRSLPRCRSIAWMPRRRLSSRARFKVLRRSPELVLPAGAGCGGAGSFRAQVVNFGP